MNKRKLLTVNSLLKNAFSLGIFSIFPGPTFLLIHYKEKKEVMHISNQILRKKMKRISGDKISALNFMLPYTQKVSILIGIADQRTLTLVLNTSVLLHITSFSVAAIKQNKTKQQRQKKKCFKALKSITSYCLKSNWRPILFLRILTSDFLSI